MIDEGNDVNIVNRVADNITCAHRRYTSGADINKFR